MCSPCDVILSQHAPGRRRVASRRGRRGEGLSQEVWGADMVLCVLRVGWRRNGERTGLKLDLLPSPLNNTTQTGSCYQRLPPEPPRGARNPSSSACWRQIAPTETTGRFPLMVLLVSTIISILLQLQNQEFLEFHEASVCRGAGNLE